MSMVALSSPVALLPWRSRWMPKPPSASEIRNRIPPQSATTNPIPSQTGWSNWGGRSFQFCRLFDHGRRRAHTRRRRLFDSSSLGTPLRRVGEMLRPEPRRCGGRPPSGRPPISDSSWAQGPRCRPTTPWRAILVRRATVKHEIVPRITLIIGSHARMQRRPQAAPVGCQVSTGCRDRLRPRPAAAGVEWRLDHGEMRWCPHRALSSRSAASGDYHRGPVGPLTRRCPHARHVRYGRRDHHRRGYEQLRSELDD